MDTLKDILKTIVRLFLIVMGYLLAAVILTIMSPAFIARRLVDMFHKEPVVHTPETCEVCQKGRYE